MPLKEQTMTLNLPLGLPVLRKLPLPRKLGLLERVYGKSLAKNGVSWVTTSNGVTWKLDLADSSQRWILYGDYEGPLQMNWIRQWLRNGGVVVDSGANIGQMFLYLAPMPNVKVVAFEPLPQAADWMEECLENYTHWDVSIYRYGLSNQKNRIPVQVAGSITTARMDWYKTRNFEKIEIDVVKLDEIACEVGIDEIRLWKLDVEGHEAQALDGARELLQKRKIDAILVEVTSADTVEVLNTVGYSVNRIERGGTLRPASKDHFEGNCIATPTA